MTTTAIDAIDEDTRAVIDALDAAQVASGLNKAGFARALGTSASRYSTYRTGKVAPSATFLMRAQRIAAALALASSRGVPSSIGAARSIREALAARGSTWAFTLILEARDRLIDIIHHRPTMLPAWEASASIGDDRWDALFTSIVANAFESNGLSAPGWTQATPLQEGWSPVESLRYDAIQTREHTPRWLAERNIFIADRDLATA